MVLLLLVLQLGLTVNSLGIWKHFNILLPTPIDMYLI